MQDDENLSIGDHDKDSESTTSKIETDFVKAAIDSSPLRQMPKATEHRKCKRCGESKPVDELCERYGICVPCEPRPYLALAVRNDKSKTPGERVQEAIDEMAGQKIRKCARCKQPKEIGAPCPCCLLGVPDP
jgi:hypothetical protein